jgi:fatty-acyl-CoA synthase
MTGPGDPGACNDGVGTWIHRRRVKSAGKTALVSGGAVVTYDLLAQRIERLATALATRGVTRGDRVAYLGDNEPSFLETFFAVTALGAIFVPLNTRLAAPEISFALHDSEAAALVHAGALTDVAEHACADIAGLGRIVVGSPASALVRPAEAFEDLIDTAGEDRPAVSVDGADIAMILYTSGTTGSPKGAAISHRNITANCFNVLVDYDLTSDDIALMISPMFHVASLTMGVLPALLKGATVILEPAFVPGRALELIQRYRVTSLSGVPTTYQMLCEHPAWASTDISSLRMLTCGGSAVPMRVLDAYEARGLSFTGGYGMTETSPGATSLPPRYSRSKAGSAGLAHFFTDVRIADSDGREQPAGKVGEIQVRGPNVIQRYWKQPEASAEAFADAGWFRSGDMGFLDEDGFLFISHRLKDMIISGGENIYPAEIERVILELDAVQGAAVVGAPDDRWGEVPHAYLEIRPGYVLEDGAVQRHLSGRLARYKIPKRVVVVDELPRTASGKIRKGEIRKIVGGEAGTGTAPETMGHPA